jgi:hypothetical protein
MTGKKQAGKQFPTTFFKKGFPRCILREPIL